MRCTNLSLVFLCLCAAPCHPPPTLTIADGNLNSEPATPGGDSRKAAPMLWLREPTWSGPACHQELAHQGVPRLLLQLPLLPCRLSTAFLSRVTQTLLHFSTVLAHHSRSTAIGTDACKGASAVAPQGILQAATHVRVCYTKMCCSDRQSISSHARFPWYNGHL